MQCVILAGGLGTRIAPVSGDLPKCLLPVGEYSFIELQLEWLRHCGVTRAVIALGYGADKVVEQLRHSALRNEFPQVSFSFDGDTPLGTGGAVRAAAAMLDEQFLVTYGDTYLFFSAEELLRAHSRSQTAVTLSIYRNGNQHEPSNVEFYDDRLVAYSKTRRTAQMAYIDYGVFVVERKQFLEYSGATAFDIADYISEAVQRNQCAAFVLEKKGYEVGSPEGYDAFRQFMQNRNVRIAV